MTAPKRILCPQCGDDGGREAFTDYLRCPDCGLVHRRFVPAVCDLDDYYLSAWARPQETVEATGATSLELAEAYARKLSTDLGRRDFEGLRILDHGAGRGDMLAVLRDRGADVFAVEPYGHGELEDRGIPTLRSLQELPEGRRFDGILSIDVVEHLEEPWHALEELRQRLETTGWLYLATPNADGVGARVKGGRWSQALNPGHLQLFTPGALTHMLRRCGFRHAKRLRWFVRYRVGPVRHLSHLLLQLLGVDGELRYLAFA